MSKLIPLEEALKIIESSKNESYIDAVDALLDVSLKMLNLPTIDPIATIDEMIRELSGNAPLPRIGRATLEELKSRLYPNL